MSQFVNTPTRTFEAGAAIGQYIRVKLVAGVLQVAAAADYGIGVTEEEAFAAGQKIAVRLWSAQGTMKMKAGAAITAGAEVRPAASGKIDDAGTTPPLGIAFEAASGDGSIIEVVPLRFSSAVAADSVVEASADHENTTTEAAFDKSIPIAANSVLEGDVLKIRGAVNVTDNNSTDTLTLKLMVGTVQVAVTAAVDVADGDVGYFDVEVCFRTIGASGTLVATGVQALGVPGTVTAKPFVLTSTAVDTTAAMDVTIRADWSVAHADNECNLEYLSVQKFSG